MIVGSKGGMQNCAVTFRENHPLFRHNLFFGLQVGSKLKYVGEDEEVNTTQKNPNVASFIGRILCKVGSSALVIGAGSGSEVVGLARVGVQVVGLEKDPKQFVALTLRLTAEASFQAKALKQVRGCGTWSCGRGARVRVSLRLRCCSEYMFQNHVQLLRNTSWPGCSLL